ncbi:Ketoglutarate semialdehyde dehydrogenase [Fulvivirga imtechensis AK7]|uniref:Ketoglutarate semialdehyde dehydrogenase n=1 Tax=Fulvivirga imtechensis AK7 TaxID=1237149 RepID=L8JJC2_9BACT|nr:aldehyde dehydrogenase (NADP(+)) [Fulvivirga imtechensis]ELR69001.1 Ketoglutarate semialdehyde dehydrogenase [Fulvivirga imtechensis AK7]
MALHGKNRIGFELLAASEEFVHSYDPKAGKALDKFYLATEDEVALALDKAAQAFDSYRYYSGKRKAEFLEAIADEILALGDELIETAMKESGLPEGRIIGERGRTMGQLRLFAQLVSEGSWVDATIETAQPDRQPLPKPDIRKMLCPVGPVVVFAASNFPLAFSTAGGDTASALAAGNPVIVKAHMSHLGTNELIAGAISQAAEKTGMPDGVFSSLNGRGSSLGQALVKHPVVKSVGFTGSFNGGMALYRAAAQREEPIPVFAEMGSVNPVVLLPGKLKKVAEEVAKQYAGSITLGVGQFCTNPGLILGIAGDEMDTFIRVLGKEIQAIAPATMLNEAIHKSYQEGKKKMLEQKGVQLAGAAKDEEGNFLGVPTVARVSGADFLSNPGLHEEVFGPFSLVVTCSGKEELREVILSVKGQLTSTIMAEENELSDYQEIVYAAANIAGRVIFNGVPTGVEVCHAMQHGGPFPASTDGRFTSVGTDAIRRFARPLAYQGFPEDALPDELKSNNPLGIWRKVNGELTREAVAGEVYI